MDSLLIEGLSGQIEMLTDYSEPERKRRVNGDHTLSFTVWETDRNTQAYALITEEAVVILDSDRYKIKNMKQPGAYKTVECVHVFYHDMMAWQEAKLNGYINFVQALNHVFGPTSWAWINQTATVPVTFDNWGDDTCLSLLQTLVERYKVEFEIDTVNKTVTFKTKIGTETDVQFRWGLNVKSYDYEIDTKNLATVMKGYGKGNLAVTYTSPNAAIYGPLPGKPLRDERYTTAEALLQACKNTIIDAPEVRIRIEIVTLTENNELPVSDYDVGDTIYILLDPIGVRSPIRILEMIDYPLSGGKKSPKVELSNFRVRRNITSVLANFAQTQKQVNDLLDEEGNLQLNIKKLYANTNVFWDNSGLWMVNPDDSNIYAHHGSGGSDYHRGGIRIERADGYATMIDGVLNRQFGILSSAPFFVHPEVQIEYEYWKTSSTEKRSCYFCTFKHENRYLKVKLAMYAQGTGGVAMFVDDIAGNTIASYASFEQSSSSDLAVYGVELTIDLGVPTGLPKSIYLRLRAGSSATIARGRMVYMALEG